MDEAIDQIPAPIDIMKSMKTKYKYFSLVKEKMKHENVRMMINDACNYLKNELFPEIKNVFDLYKDSVFAEAFKGKTMSIFNKRNVVNNPKFPHRSQLQATFGSQLAILMALLPYWFPDDKHSIYKFLVHKFGQPQKAPSFNYWRDYDCVRWEIAGYCLNKNIKLEEFLDSAVGKNEFATPLNEVNGCKYELICKHFPEYKHLFPKKNTSVYFVYLIKGVLIDNLSIKKIFKLGVSKYPDTYRMQQLSKDIDNIEIICLEGPYDYLLARKIEGDLLTVVNSIAPVGKCNFTMEFDGMSECWLEEKYAPENIDVLKSKIQKRSFQKPDRQISVQPEEWDFFE